MSGKPEDRKNPLSGHRERIRTRLELDPQSVADYEVMELLLGLALLRKDTKLLAHRLLDEFGGMRGRLTRVPMSWKALTALALVCSRSGG